MKKHKQSQASRYTPIEDGPSPEVTEALSLVKAIQDTYDDEVSDRAKERGEEFFDSVLEKSASIGETIERTKRVSEAQINALESMLKGVKKWVHRNDD